MLNSINAQKWKLMPYLEDTMDRIYDGIETRIKRLSKREYTSIHPKCLWKFRQEAERHIGFYREEFDLPYRKITFEYLTPLLDKPDIQKLFGFQKFGN